MVAHAAGAVLAATLILVLLLASRAVDGPFWSRPILQGSGWVFTTAGAAFAFYTALQVGSKNSAFRRAIVKLTRRGAHERLDDSRKALASLSEQLSRTTDTTGLRRLAAKWVGPASELRAHVQTVLADDPLDIALGSVVPEESEHGAKFRRAVINRRRKTEGGGSSHLGKALMDEIVTSIEAARSVSATPGDPEKEAEFRSAVMTVVAESSFVARRLAYASGGELHDD